MSTKKTPHVEHRGLRIRRSMAAFLIALSGVVTSCTPAEIERSIQMLTVSFEEGGVESGLSTAALIGQVAVPVIGMRLGSFAP